MLSLSQTLSSFLLNFVTVHPRRRAACAEVGVTYGTLRNWLNKARSATEGFWANFLIAYTRARAPYWEAATQRLSRRNPEVILSNECPEEWNTSQRVEVSLVDADPFDLLKDKGVTDALDRAFARRCARDPLAESGCSRE